MIPHACDMINRYLVGEDGRTAHYRLFNKHFHHNTLEYGEVVLAKPLRKPKQNRKRALKSRVVDGIWLGIHGQTNEHRVALPDGGPVIKVRTVIRRPDPEKLDVEAICAIKAAPARPNPKNEDQMEPENIKNMKGLDIGGDGSKLPEAPTRDVEAGLHRNFRISADILE